MSEHEVVVVGAGPAGLSAALALSDAGVRPLVLDHADRVGSSWRTRYDRLRLNSPRPLSHLPGRRFPKGTPMFPTRDQVIEHLERHALSDGIDLLLGTRVERIARDDKRWLVHTSAGEIRATQVVVATGYEHQPFIPDWSGRDSFSGPVLHSSEYRNATPFHRKQVLVVGPGCSGMEIAYDLAEGGASKVWLSARTPPNIVLRQGPGGLPGDYIALLLLHLPTRLGDAIARLGRRLDLGDLTEYGLPIPNEGIFARLHRLGVAPAIVDKEVIEAIKAGQIEVVRGVESLDPTGVHLADGVRVQPDVVICATGYQRALEPLVGGLDVLDEHGAPRAVGRQPAAAGLRFIGYTPRPSQLGYASKTARRAAKSIAHELRSAGSSPPA
jgi:cation diffusion facilitator CzcD-associated flavoprotein CzcO